MAGMGIRLHALSLSIMLEANQIPVPKDKRGEAPFSVDANLLHISAEGKVLEDPANAAEEYVFTYSCS